MIQANESMKANITAAIEARTDRISNVSDSSDVLGIPVKRRTEAHQEAKGTQSRETKSTEAVMEWDAFISRASEDKDLFVRPLVDLLTNHGLTVWYDEFSLKVGDSLRRSIEFGLSRSRFGIVVISPSFLAKEWPQRELDGLAARESGGEKVILPVWYDISYEEILASAPMLSDKVAAHSKDGLDVVARKLMEVIRE